jgi:hypothetical protein
MGIIDARKKALKSPKIYSDFDWQTRRFGEQRVSAKSNINDLINSVYNKQLRRSKDKSWTGNDIVYSVGDMVDRLTIEFIKICDYRTRLKTIKNHNFEKEALNSKMSLAKEWSARVERYLDWKLKSVNKGGYYESVRETRTYDLSSVR